MVHRTYASRAEVLIVGAGPTGLMLAAELARHGVQPRLVDRRSGPVRESRALAVLPRTMEIFDDLGIADRAVRRGTPIVGIQIHDGSTKIAAISLDATDSPFPFSVALPQSSTEAILLEHGVGFGVRPEWGVEAVAWRGGDANASVVLRHPDASEEYCTADWLVACDGAHSMIRETANIGRSGRELHRTFLLADVRTMWELDRDKIHVLLGGHGVFAAVPLPMPGYWRLIVDYEGDDAWQLGRYPDIEVFRRLVATDTPLSPQLTDPLWTNQFGARQRRAETFRRGRTVLCGDSAHSHSPVGGQGMNTGLQDAYNLGWKLALAVRGHAGAGIVDSYTAEREPVATEVLRRTERATRMVTLHSPAPRLVRDRFLRLIDRVGRAQGQVTRIFGGLNIAYRDSPIVADHWRLDAQPVGPPTPPAPVAGELAPDGFLRGTAGYETLRHLLRGPGHHLLLFSGHEELSRVTAVADRARRVLGSLGWVQCVVRSPLVDVPPGVLVDQHGEVHRRYGVQQPSMYLVRPDGYLGLRADSHDLALCSGYLRRLSG